MLHTVRTGHVCIVILPCFIPARVCQSAQDSPELSFAVTTHSYSNGHGVDSFLWAFCRVILDFVADIRGEDAGKLAEAAFANAQKLFKQQS